MKRYLLKPNQKKDMEIVIITNVPLKEIREMLVPGVKIKEKNERINKIC